MTTRWPALNCDAFTHYLKRYSQREQLLLLFCLLLIALTALWLLFWQPLMDAKARSEARLAYAVEALGEVNMLAAELEYLRQTSVNNNTQSASAQSLPQMLDALSSKSGASSSLPGQAGIVIASLEPSADNRSAGLRFDAVPMSDLLVWLAELESLASIQLEQINIAPTSGNQASVVNSVRDNTALVNATLRVRSQP